MMTSEAMNSWLERIRTVTATDEARSKAMFLLKELTHNVGGRAYEQADIDLLARALTEAASNSRSAGDQP